MNRIPTIRTCAFVIFVCLMLGGCGSWQGAEEVDTEPEEGSSEGPGLFTGKKGGIIFHVEIWTGAAPYDEDVE